MAKKKKAQDGARTRIGAWEEYTNQQMGTGVPDPMAQLKKIQGMKVTPNAPQSYGVQKTDPQASLTSRLGKYNKRKPMDMDWSNILAGGLLAANALIPLDEPQNPVVRPQVGYDPHMYGTGSQAIAKSGIHIKPSKKGTFTAAAKKHGKSVQGFASQVLSNKENYSPAMVKKANFARNASKWKKGEHGLTISDTGYQSTSPDKNKKKLRIPSNQITMEGVDFPVIGVSDTGDTQYMLPGGEYYFDGNYVDETPLAKNGLSASKAKEMLRDGTAHGKKLTAKQKRYFGFIAGGGKAQNGMNVVGTPQQRDQANLEAQRLAAKYRMMDHANMQIGQYLPQYVNEAGKPYQGAPTTKQLPTTVPSYINLEDIQTEQGLYWYNDPHTGDPVDIDPTAIRSPRFQKSQALVQKDLMGRSMASRKHGGSVSPISNNTVKINGHSHSEGGVPFMGIEAEGGETAYKAFDGSVNIMGNMINPLTGRKFKEDSKRLAKKERRMDELMDYSMDLVNDSNIQDKYDILKFNSGKVQFEGASRKRAELKQSQEHLSNIQQAMLDFSEEKGIDPGAFSRGQFKKAVYDGKAQNGWRFEGTRKENLDKKILEFVKLLETKGFTGRSGKESGLSMRNTKSGNPSRHASNEALDTFFDKPGAYEAILNDPQLTKFLVDSGLTVLNEYDPKVKQKTGATTGHLHIGYDMGTGISEQFRKDAASKYKTNNPDWGWEVRRTPSGKLLKGSPAGDQQNFEETTPPTTFNPTKPNFPGAPEASRVGRRDYDLTVKNPKNYFAPSDARGLSMTQILPELYAAATNQVEPVYMQEYTPQLYQDYEVSFQDQLNENQATFSALSKAVGNDPSTLSVLAGQKYGADSGVLANEFRTNQAIEQDIVNKNISLLNDAELKNLGLADTQFVRQSTAKSKTKAQNQLVLSSIADKIHQNEYEQRLQKTYENLYPNYRFGEDYVTDYYGPTAGEAVNFEGAVTPIQDDAQVTIKQDAKGNITTTKKFPSNIQKQLQDINLSTKKLKYNDYFINRERNFAKRGRNFLNF